MNYYTETNYIDHDDLRTAGGKGRDDYFEVLRRTGLKCIRIPTLKKKADSSPVDRIKLEAQLRRAWNKELSVLKDGDVIVLHSPVSEKFLGYPGVIRRASKRGCHIVNIVFDLETFYKSDYSKAAAFKHFLDRRTEAAIFDTADVLIVHNERMKDKLISIGADPSRIVCVGVMDYLRDDSPAAEAREGISDDSSVRESMAREGSAPADGSQDLSSPAAEAREGSASETGDEFDPSAETASKAREGSAPGRFTPDGPIVFCGNLLESKSGFVYRLKDDVRIDLYGPGFTGRTSDMIRYRGVYPSLELMDIMCGSFGLVWDGSSTETCIGACGEYLRYNNPHKMSHYLASGMPVLIWKEAALADFVTEQGCGMTIGSLGEIPELLGSVTPEAYEKMRQAAGRVGRKMREGAHIRAAVEEAVRMAGSIGR
ncbi:MAG: hypothetical protein E7220_05135 [Clostridiales bacterium]|nr:hypothetical protein [Clostridiales bacterium]